jgi:hypothetical protein
MKFEKVIKELKGEVGNAQLFSIGRGQGSPRSEIEDQKIIHAIYRFIQANAAKYPDLWKEIQPKDMTELDIVPNVTRDGAIINTEGGSKWLATVSPQGKVLSLKKTK